MWVFVCSSWGIPTFISCFLNVFPWNSTSCPLLFTYLLIISWPNPPSLPPSSVFFFPLPLSNLLTQSLNLLEPRDPVCYVNGETKTHMCSHIWTCLLPAHTHAHTCSVLSFAAFGRRSAFLLLTRWCSVYKNCQSHINQSFALWAQHIRGLRKYAVVGSPTLIWLHPDGRMCCSFFKRLLLHLFQTMWWGKCMWGLLRIWMRHVS